MLERSSGNPIAGAVLSMGALTMDSEQLARGRGAAGFLMQPLPAQEIGHTDALGELNVNRRVLLRDRLAVRAQGYLEYREPARLRELHGEVYVIVLQAALPARVVVTGPDGSPAKKLRVTLSGSTGAKQQLVTDLGGAATFHWNDSFVTLAIDQDGYAAVQDLAEVPLAEITLQPGKQLTARVVDSDGEPVAACVIEQSTSLWRGPPQRSESSSSGHFTTLSLPPRGTLAMRLQHPDFPTMTINQTLPLRDDFEVVLASGATVVGSVDSELTDLLVRLVPIDGEFHSRDVVKAAVGDSGKFCIGPVAAGDYSLVVERQQVVLMESPVRQLEDSEQRLLQQLSVQSAIDSCHAMSGVVRDSDGAPLVGVRLQIGAVHGDELRGPIVESAADGSFSFPRVARAAPRAYPRGRDLRWRALEAAAVPEPDASKVVYHDHGLVLEVLAPHQLLAVDGEAIRDHGMIGSRNTCMVLPGTAALQVHVAKPSVQVRDLIALEDVYGLPLRVVTNLLIVPLEDSLQEKSIVFAGMDGDPVKLRNAATLDRALIGVLSRRYAAHYEVCDLRGSLPLTVQLEKRVTRSVALLDRKGQGLAERAVFARPILRHSGPAVALYAGVTNTNGVLTQDYFASGRYELFYAESPSAAADGTRVGISAAKLSDLTLVGTIDWALDSGGTTEVHMTDQDH